MWIQFLLNRVNEFPTGHVDSVTTACIDSVPTVHVESVPIGGTLCGIRMATQDSLCKCHTNCSPFPMT